MSVARGSTEEDFIWEGGWELNLIRFDLPLFFLLHVLSMSERGKDDEVGRVEKEEVGGGESPPLTNTHMYA